MTPKQKPLIHLPLDGDCPIVTDAQTSKEDKQEALRDYDTIRRSIEYLTDHWREQPSLERLSDHIGLSPHHLQRLFTRWTGGLSPKGFIQAVTLDNAKKILDQSASVMEASFEVGLSGSSRLHDLFVTHEAITPGAYKAKGEGLTILFGFHPSPFGKALVMVTDHGLAGLAFADKGDEQAALSDMYSRWPRANYQQDDEATRPFAAHIFTPQAWQQEQPLRITLIGTDFEVRVWEMLLKIPLGNMTTYSTIARHMGKPKAARAVGSAVGRNPISFVVPCHRVVGKGGSICGYHWGLTRKRAILGWEQGHLGGNDI
ncbi:AraC family transcriptional regulator, regulatory protein of adaptative response / methylated-DNA-[protein]-cysteine methyltransferase [Cohaesibacter marisflavi]|uniref:methylated-DNA--[protein]-cysteine S-methyltransferase n=1 Tax=Cohaesibacter marisflavi TaxID=655353 RepID=A0A1I5GNG5_9HYPH|nr:bifunctional helix-turn-helix domain-containing protein/methylated-DNA--[protein]-cysteine S-methyltransferase [Cohaesibacter marisflavi]SFO37513.1 AraC family transcriptional regulator, regulatory protein of adaptative response / methylated-DNA-[protein]-cysteine methyltransferase [Cohaesibacter marisflavi]